MSCSHFNDENNIKSINFKHLYLKIQDEIICDQKENYICVFLYIKEVGCHTCNLNIMNDLNELVALEGYQFSCYFATEATHLKRVVKSMNLNYEVHFGKELAEFENLLCEDGKILLISTDIPDQYQKACNFDELLATLQSVDSN